jgi:RimJ/RimL family protein N-acetyltransferase
MSDFRQPILQNDCVLLRPLEYVDFQALFKVASDPLIWEQHPAKNRCNEDGFSIFFSDAMDSGGALVIEDNERGEIIGSSRYQLLEENEDAIEIGWTFLARKYWGGKYNRSVKNLMIQHAFNYVGEIIFFIDIDNFRSQKATEKLGAKLLKPQDHPYYKGRSDKYLTFRILK